VARILPEKTMPFSTPSSRRESWHSPQFRLGEYKTRTISGGAQIGFDATTSGGFLE